MGERERGGGGGVGGWCWCTEPMSGPYGVSLWKSISQEWLTFYSFLQYDVGDGTRVIQGECVVWRLSS